MPLFDTHIVVDWSARSKPSPANPSKDAIWWAVAHGGVVTTRYVRTRREAIDDLLHLFEAETSAGRRVLAGFDFPFGYPAGVAAHLTRRASALALWEWLALRVHDGKNNANNRYSVAAEINNAYPGVGPFWGRHPNWSCLCVPLRASERTCRHSHPAEKRVADEYAPGAKSVWQLFYNGSVGSQVLLGLSALNRLRRNPALSGSVAVWPFDSGLGAPDAPLVLAEVYPSLLKDAVDEHRGEDEVLDSAQVRVNARAFASLDAKGELRSLFNGAPSLTAEQRELVEREEGWILGLGHEQALEDAVAKEDGRSE